MKPRSWPVGCERVWAGVCGRDRVWAPSSKTRQTSHWGEASVLTSSWYSMLGLNWWRDKYLTQRFHHNSEDVMQEIDVGCTCMLNLPKAMNKVAAIVNTQRRVASECWGNRSVSSIRITPWHLNPPAPSPNRPLDAVKNKTCIWSYTILVIYAQN